MKTAVITSKNEFGQIETEKVIVMACMDRREHEERIQGFYEVRPFNNPKITNCRWIFEDSIEEN